MNWIQRKQHVQDQQRTDDEDRQVAELVLLLILVVEERVADEDGVDENDEHVRDLDPFVVGVLYLVAHGVEHVVAGFGEEPPNHK